MDFTNGTIEHLKRWLLILLVTLVPVIVGVGPVPAQEPLQKESPEFVPGELLVKFRQPDEPAVRGNVLGHAGAQILEILPDGQWHRVQVPTGQERMAQVSLSALPEVVAAWPNYIITPASIPNDTSFSTQWNLNNIGQEGGTPGADIDGPKAWNIHTGGRGGIVAIADTGIDLDHEDLNDRIWANLDEIPNNDIDDDNNGYVDDVNGWNFCPSFGCSSENNNPDDDSGHGTHLAGIVGATETTTKEYPAWAGT